MKNLGQRDMDEMPGTKRRYPTYELIHDLLLFFVMSVKRPEGEQRVSASVLLILS